jgi:hypothetical protein
MAALNLADIPSNINSYERLAMWAAQCCQSIANGLQVNAVTGEAQVPAAQVQIAKTADNVDRAICVLYLPVDYEALNDPDEKTWMAATDLGNVAPHTNLLSN